MLAEELGRRLVNMDPYHTEEERTAVVEDYLPKLADSGYNQDHRQEILRSGCKKFCMRQIEDITGGKLIYRREAKMKASRKSNKFNNQYCFKSPRGG